MTSPDIQHRLRECPFCGGEAHESEPEVSAGLWEIGCWANWTTKHPCAAGPAVSGKTRAEAVAAWNRRSDADTIAQLVKERDEAEGRATRNWSNLQRVWAKILGDRPRCRDCADHDGTCPHSSLPCDPTAAAIATALAAESRASKAEAEAATLREALERTEAALMQALAAVRRRANCNGGWWNDRSVFDLMYDMEKRFRWLEATHDGPVRRARTQQHGAKE
jgi:hypothetical protein